MWEEKSGFKSAALQVEQESEKSDAPDVFLDAGFTLPGETGIFG